MVLLICVYIFAMIASPNVYAAVSITLNPSAINASMGTIATTTVTVTNTDPTDHTVSLSLVTSSGTWPATFSPNPLIVLAGSSANSVLNIPLSGPDAFCPSIEFPGPYMIAFTVQAKEGSTVLATGSLTMNLLSPVYAISVDVASSKSSYMIGEKVILTLTSNPQVPAHYFLRIVAPDSSVWGTAQGYLPRATYSKDATSPTGTYTATLTATYCGTYQDTQSFSIVPNTYDVTVSIAGLPGNLATTLTVDGSSFAELNGGDVRVLSYPIGTSHTFQVDAYVNGPQGYRYYCSSSSWNSGATGSYTFNYISQYYLDIRTDPANVTSIGSSGWFAAGSQATVPAAQNIVNGTGGVRYVFSGWMEDGSAVTQNGFAITMNAPHSVVATYKTQYQLIVDSPNGLGDPRGSGYYDSGSTATFTVTTPVGVVIQQVFTGWDGDFTGTSPTGSITMDKPHNVHANWTTSYFQLYLIIGVLAAIAVVAGLLLWRRRASMAPPETKPTPPATGEPEQPTEELPPPSGESVPCPSCGTAVPVGQTYCQNCGTKIV
jgi:hypothetical protein